MFEVLDELFMMEKCFDWGNAVPNVKSVIDGLAITGTYVHTGGSTRLGQITMLI